MQDNSCADPRDRPNIQTCAEHEPPARGAAAGDETGTENVATAARQADDGAPAARHDNGAPAARREAERALQEAEERYHRLFEEVKDAVYFSTPEGRLVDINPAGVELFGYSSKEELLWEAMARDLYWDPADRDANTRVLKERGFVKDHELLLKTRQGHKIQVLQTATAVRDETGRVTGYQGILRDVTAQRDLEQQLRLAQKMEAIGRLAGAVAHDFNNLLMVIGGFAERALGQLDAAHPARWDLEEITAAGDRAVSLTRKLLAFGRRQVLRQTALDLNAIVTELEKMLRLAVGEDVELALVLEPAAGRVRADPGQVEQILMNLAVNAQEAMPRGGRLTIETANVELSPAETRRHPDLEPGRYVRLEVRDTGSGIDAAQRDRIFEPFFTSKQNGTGLGLATVYGIVQQHGGWITADNVPLRGDATGHRVPAGARFRIYLPRVASEPPPEPRAEAVIQPPRGSETILVVDDEEAVRNVAALSLEDRGYNVLIADGPQEALELCRQNDGEVDLMVTDIVMPGMSGVELAELLQDRLGEAKVIYMSGYSGDVVFDKSQLDPSAAFLEKPFGPAKLLSMVREVLDRTPND